MRLELLSPAKNLECGIVAIDNGADAVYIGADNFSARMAAGNSLDDIERLVVYAHQYGAKVYVTVNTILYDEELDEARQLVTLLYGIGVDALIVQDLALLQIAQEMPCPPLHASTQMDVRSVEKVQWLWSLGFRRVVLARELSLKEIAAIHDAVPEMELEVFVHGALCVSYSGQCYASQYCFGRSANRGNCAQFCRLRFNLEDAQGGVLVKNRYLLSLKDMNRIERLGDLVNAGAVSFKIEGRLKDADYVKNITAAYSLALDKVIESHAQTDGFTRASYGHCRYTFVPNVMKTFNRTFTSYFLDGGNDGVANISTPKSLGEEVGEVKEMRRNAFTVAGVESFSAGDGLCFFNAEGNLEGFRVNRAEGNMLYPHRMPSGLCRGVRLYRNNNEAFRRQLASSKTQRKIFADMIFEETSDGFRLTMSDESGRCATAEVAFAKEKARQPQTENIIRQLSKLGNTVFECRGIEVRLNDDYFIPSSLLSDLRQSVCREMERYDHILRPMGEPLMVKSSQTSWRCNVSNALSRRYYADGVLPAFELMQPKDEKLIMQCRHCVLFALGKCRKSERRDAAYRDPLYMSLPDGRRFRLGFNCVECQMNVYAE
ncbi:MAG: U32 family peptidase [Prevotella sp.]|nr:U32 family peptidase [Candidatus Equicola faecalis]